MNRYPLWKYITVLFALLIGFIYTLPNFFGEVPAVQVSSKRATLKLDDNSLTRIKEILTTAGIENDGAFLDATGAKVRLFNDDAQKQARNLLDAALNPDKNDPDYVVATNRLSAAPAWLASIHARPMYLGLDLRGGVHFLLQVDMAGAELKRLDSLAADLRLLLRDKRLRHAGIDREGKGISIKFRDDGNIKAAETRVSVQTLIGREIPELRLVESGDANTPALTATLRPEALLKLGEDALKQNISTLHNRINELGVAEPVITQQGADRIVVQLPGVEDPAQAKDLLGRTATLEIRMVDETPGALESALSGSVPFGDELLFERDRDNNQRPILLKKQVVLTGERLTNAQPGFDENQQPAVHLSFDPVGSNIFREISRNNIGKRMAILLIEKNKAEVVTAPVIRSEIGGGRVQISGSMSSIEANNIALLLRSGSLAAPMEIIEERSVGPSLGADNIKKGFHSTIWGFVVIVAFMCVYYRMFGFISGLALSANLLFLIALLSMLQATLTLPGIAAIALTLGMAIDANVLINERVREELRAGMPPQTAIVTGYERAFGTILDSNITTLIAGLALLIFGSGPVRGFAVVHCLGILTSIFSAVVVSRALVNLIYGGHKKLTRISIGQIWKPAESTAK